MRTKFDPSIIKNLDYLQNEEPAKTAADEFAEAVKRHASSRPRKPGKGPQAVWDEVIYPQSDKEKKEENPEHPNQ
jgi:hypothetical protein